MPQAKQESSPGLSIELSNAPKYYTVGSKVNGEVVFNVAEDFAVGSLKLEFYGRAKVHLIQRHGEAQTHWRGRAPLLSESVFLYEGFHTYRGNAFHWPFTFEIPTHPNLNAIKQAKSQWKEKQPFLSTEGDVSGHPMPGTFHFERSGFGYEWHVFVEYVLRAEVKQTEGIRRLLPASARKTVLPIVVKEIATEHILTSSLTLTAQPMSGDFSNSSWSGQSELTREVSTHTVRSARFIDSETQGLPTRRRSSISSFLEKTRQVFNVSSLPKYTFEISVSTPKSIQLLRQDAIPFVISASSIEASDNTTIQPEDYPEVRIENVSIYLSASTHLRCKGPLGTKSIEYDILLLERQPVDHILDVRPKDESVQNIVALRHSHDISTLPGLSVRVIAATLGTQVECPLMPSFSTYVIARDYKLKWNLELDVAGEKVKVRNKDDIPVRVLPPSRDDLDVLIAQRDVRGDVSIEYAERRPQENNPLNVFSFSNTIQSKSGEVRQGEAIEEHGIPQLCDQPIQSRHDEMLPTYQTPLDDLQYRHEIDESVPQYNNEDESQLWQNRHPWGRKSTQEELVAY